MSHGPVGWPSVSGLHLRMVLTVLVMILLPVGFIYSFVWGANVAAGELYPLVTGYEFLGEFYVSPFLAFGAVAGAFLLQWLIGRWVALRSIGARTVDPDEHPELHNRVSRLAAQADLSKPAVAVSSGDVPNAFAVGRTPSDATIAVTEGLLSTLNDDELDAVLAHEIAHVKNRDMSVMTVAYLLPTVTYVIATVSWFLLKVGIGTFGRSASVDSDGAKGRLALFVVFITGTLGTLAISVFFWVASFSVFRLLSRYREYTADSGAVAITGDPAALASALRTVESDIDDRPDDDLRAQDGGTEALYFASIDTAQFESDRELLSQDFFPETHPPTENRIERLREVSAE